MGPAELAVLNEQVDAHNPKRGVVGGLEPEEAAALLEDPDDPAGKELQQGFGDGVNILGAHPCFDALIDHPSWIGHIETFIGGADRPTFTGASCIIRWPGQASRLHSGGHMRTTGTQYVYHAGEFRCGDINIMLALNDCPLGGGGTALVPGSHKSNVEHPAFDGSPQRGWKDRGRPVPLRNGETATSGGFMDGALGAQEIPLEAGDALM